MKLTITLFSLLLAANCLAQLAVFEAATFGAGDPPATFTNTTVTNLVGWWAADSLTASDNDSVASVDDWSGNSKTITQSTAGAKPTYKTGIVNGKPVLRFDGGDYMQVGTDSPATLRCDPPISYVIVARLTVTNASNTFVAGSAGGATVFRTGDSGNVGKLSIVQSLVAEKAVGTGLLQTNAWYVLGMTIDASGNWKFYVNAATDSSGSATVWDNSAPTLAIGADATAYNFLTGDMPEVLVWNRAITDGDYNTVRTYLASKYGL